MKNNTAKENRITALANKIYEKINDMFKSYERALRDTRIAEGYYYVPGRIYIA